MPLQRIESLRQSAAAEEKMTTSKHGWTTFDVDTASREEFLSAYSESVLE
jgi:hypothetical protein